jgi:DNA repair protein RadC
MLDLCSVSSTLGPPLAGELPSPPLLARERLWQFGSDRVSDDELVAILLGTGMRGRSVWEVAADVMRNAGGLSALSRATPQELIHTSGMGACRAVRVVAAFELGRRALFQQAHAQPIRGPEDIARMLMRRFSGMAQECFIVIGVDVRNQLVAEVEVARGTLVAVEVHPREVFRPLIRMSAAGAIVAHNHPSGDPTPSSEDLELTRRLREVGEMIGIPIIDHVVVAGSRFRSINEWVGTAL